MAELALELRVEGEAAMEALGARLARCFPGGGLVLLRGDLGAGKTTLVRGLLRGLGYEGRVKSPTYTLVEPYDIGGRVVQHLDLYRLADPEELEWIGVRDLFGEDVLALVEWPERGAGVLPTPDLEIRIEHAGEARLLHFFPRSKRLEDALHQLAAE
ncbi:MAG TPA: tRNA (adenosine(37)-N6)-threonylcarbamoyltransferase complex ATPase subunit type 1 TsaE [Thiotrichales bacterium]|nr:tRNA (adenosine(37)-N6)-threonylcarbamoyltransferase complex ATPase subunit type 1 TsaE [Thiotrichales bacterium]